MNQWQLSLRILQYRLMNTSNKLAKQFKQRLNYAKVSRIIWSQESRFMKELQQFIIGTTQLNGITQLNFWFQKQLRI